MSTDESKVRKRGFPKQEYDYTGLYRARIHLMMDIDPKCWKKLTNIHIRKYPCDSNLKILLKFFYDEIRDTEMTRDPEQFQKYRIKTVMSESFLEKYGDKIKYFLR